MDINSILLRHSQIRKYLTKEITLREKIKKKFFLKKNFSTNLSKPDFFFIGLQKSGSSWLSEIFKINGYIETINEMHFFDSMIDKKLFFHKFKKHDSQFLNSLAFIALNSKHINLYEDKIFLNLATRYYKNFIFELKKKLNVQLISDETPEYIFFLDILNQKFPNTKQVVILRNPKDRIVSRFFNEKRKNRYDDNKISDFFINSFLARINLEYEILLKNKYRDKIYLLTFENLKKNFLQEMESLLKFLNLKLNKTKLTEIMQKTQLKNLKKEKPKSVFRKGKVGDYSKYLSKEKIFFINRMFFQKHKEIEKIYNVNLDNHYYK